MEFIIATDGNIRNRGRRKYDYYSTSYFSAKTIFKTMKCPFLNRNTMAGHKMSDALSMLSGVSYLFLLWLEVIGDIY